MDLDIEFLKGLGLGAGASSIVAIAYALSRFYGTGKERLDFASTSRDALVKQIEQLQVQLDKAWQDNSLLRQSWVNEYNLFDQYKRRIEDECNAVKIKLALTEADNRLLTQKLVVAETEIARLRNVVSAPNVYPQDYFPIKPLPDTPSTDPPKDT